MPAGYHVETRLQINIDEGGALTTKPNVVLSLQADHVDQQRQTELKASRV